MLSLEEAESGHSDDVSTLQREVAKLKKDVVELEAKNGQILRPGRAVVIYASRE